MTPERSSTGLAPRREYASIPVLRERRLEPVGWFRLLQRRIYPPAQAYQS